ncbi:outer membrane lipoprotein chaperone LolA [Campylobacter sp. RM9344]|uniref:Outer membrane lipoprotein chaperone LolA n=1 Tax=Campylobacter californiensis TaxID=1032243 RepID=A0AAW3ZVC4_9BACT|nr:MULTISPECIES: LolA-like outer membrane lipoprotein chaperone [unclassified Campylobacter]MBE2983794.1 outer membrane lipoprotein chaperone LolA [Campylobacter sp. RM6883]MBE2994332.1 outer membrane lipoprotein chaperone LolA [Campylobacter sp. RM6913]MBE3028640.1 outer membrane lipoprotein chaperone LolA [Campylobacter sp. RM9344]MBE3607529.1 outer membrane lipoprotein chaperone LolA [Campylobacter sp. RM9337]MBE3609129.1 outer membrane lipoprotein chaperone LolA [Campylobacter sp. RM12916]
MRKILIVFLLALPGFCAGLNFKSLQSDFTQTVNSQNQSISYSGKFYARNDNVALWIYESPTPKKIYFDKQRVVIVEDELEQAIISRLDETPNLTQILTHAMQIQPTLYKAIYDGVEYFITVKNDLPTMIDYKDRLDNKIKITLKNQVANKQISEEILTPVIPQGYDIINQ